MDRRDWSSLCCYRGIILVRRQMAYVLEENGKKQGITERSSGTKIHVCD